MDVAHLKATISLDDNALQSGLKRADKKLDDTARNAKASGKAFDDFAEAARKSGVTVGNSLDGAEGKARGFGRSLTALQQSGRNAFQALERGAQHATSSISHLGNAAPAAFRGISHAAGLAAGSVRGVGSAAGAAADQFRNLALVGSGALAGALTLVGKRGLEMNGAVQGASLALGKLLGSSQAASRFVEALRLEAAQSIPSFRELVPLATQLVQAYGPEHLGRVIPTIRAFGDAAQIAAGGDTERMSLALLGFRQLLSRDFAQTEELNQIGENLGVNIQKMLKRAFGTADTEALKSAGITGRRVGDAIVAGLTREFGGAQLALAKSLGGLTSNIGDAFDALSARVTGGFGEKLRQAADVFLGFLQRLQQSAGGARLLDQLAAAFTRIGDAVLYAVSRFPAILSQALPLLSQFGEGVASIIRSLADLAGRQDVVGALLAPFQAAGKVVVWLVAQLPKLSELIPPIIDGFKMLGIAALATFGAITGMLTQQFLPTIKTAFEPENIRKFFLGIINGVGEGIRFLFAFGRAANELQRIIQSLFEDISDQVHDLTRGMSLAVKGMTVEMGITFRDMAIDIVQTMHTIVSGLTALPLGMGAAFKDAEKSLFKRWDILTDQRDGPINRKGTDAFKRAELQREGHAEELFRIRRFQQRHTEDPRRGMPFGMRMEGAWTGRFEKTAEEDFFKRFEANRNALNRFFAPPEQPPVPRVMPPTFPGAPSLAPGVAAGSGSVRIVPDRTPAVPAFPFPMPGALRPGGAPTADDIYRQQFGQASGAANQAASTLQQAAGALSRIAAAPLAGVQGFNAPGGPVQAHLRAFGSLPDRFGDRVRWAEQSMANRAAIEGRFQGMGFGKIPTMEPFALPEVLKGYANPPAARGGDQFTIVLQSGNRRQIVQDPEFQRELAALLQRWEERKLSQGGFNTVDPGF